MNKVQNEIVVQSLVGGHQIDFYLRCLRSLLQNCQDPIELLVHSDGSLSGEDEDKILALFADRKVSTVSFADSTEKTLDELEGKPNCQKFREESIWGIEFFDPLFAKPDDPFSFYLDADILFIKPFTGLFDYEIVRGGCVFLQDTQWDAYSIRPWHMLGIGKTPSLVKGITTAIVNWDKEVIDWDYLEWFLGQHRYHNIHEWIMPTAQAGLASRCEAKTIVNTQVLNMYPNAKIREETFGLHFLGSYRKEWLKKFQKHKVSKHINTDPLRLRFENCKIQKPINYGLNQAKRWVNTRLNIW